MIAEKNEVERECRDLHEINKVLLTECVIFNLNLHLTRFTYILVIFV